MIDLTQATLQEWAMKQGIDADIESMTQAQKTMLRYQYVLSQGRAAMNDFQRTQDTWHNQTTILKQSFIALNTVIGQGLINALKPALKGLNAFLGAVIDFSQQVVNALGKIFGWKYEITGGGIADDTLADLEDMSDSLGSLGDNPLSDALDGSDAVADALDDATEAAEEFKATILGFDELNVLNDISETVAKATGKGSGLDGDAGDDGSAGASGSGLGNLGGYDSALEGHLEKVESLFESEIDNLYDLGKHISDTLKKTLDGIDWDSIYQKARNFGKGLAQFLNGLLQPETFYTIGKTIANSLNTAVQAGIGFVYTFDWKKAGDAFNAGLRGIFEHIKWNEIFKLADGLGKGIADYLNHLFTPELFREVGYSFANALNTAFHFLDSFGQTFDFVNFGASLAAGLNNFMHKIEWDKALSAAESFGTGIADAINKFIDDTQFETVGSTVANALKTALTLFFSITGNIEWGDLGTKIATAINTFFEELEPNDFTDGVNGIIQGLNDAIANFKDTLKTDEMRQKIAEIIDGLDWKGIGSLLKEATKVDFALSIVSFLVGGFKENPVRKALEVGFGGFADVIKLVIAGKLLGVGGASVAATSAGAAVGGGFISGLLSTIPTLGVAASLIYTSLQHTNENTTYFSETERMWKEHGENIVKTGNTYFKTFGDDLSKTWDEAQVTVSRNGDLLLTKYNALGQEVQMWVKKGSEDYEYFYKKAHSIAAEETEGMKNDVTRNFSQTWDEVLRNAQTNGTDLTTLVKAVFGENTSILDKSSEEQLAILKQYTSGVKSKHEGMFELICRVTEAGWSDAEKSTDEHTAEMDKDVKTKTESISRNVKDFQDKVNRDYEDALEKLASTTDEKWGEAEGHTSTHLGNIDNDVSDKLYNVSSAVENNISGLPYSFDAYFGQAKDNALWQLGELEAQAAGYLSNVNSWLDDALYNFSHADFTIGRVGPVANWYAEGGFPSVGEIFVAREAGAEMVGRIGTRTAVANNDQIVAGIKAGVMDAMMQVYSATGSNRSSSAPLTNDITVKVGEETLYRAVVRGKQKHERRYQTVAVVQ